MDSGLSSATKGEKIVANLETKLQIPKLVATTEIGNISVFPIKATLYTELIPNLDPKIKIAIQNCESVLIKIRLIIPAKPIKQDNDKIAFSPNFLYRIPERQYATISDELEAIPLAYKSPCKYFSW